MKQKLQAYRHADTMGKSPLDLILMVYDGAIKALKTAAEHYSSERNQAGYDEVQKAKRMVTHLYTTLDKEKGGQIAANLGKVYSWTLAQLQLIEATRDVQQLDVVIRALGNLRSGWAALKSRPEAGNDGTRAGDGEGELENVEHVFTTA